MNGFGTLERLARRTAPEKRCDLCGSAVPPQHEHLLQPAKRTLLCTCPACAILFSEQSGQPYKRVPSRVRVLPQFRLTDAEWNSFLIPINMAFFFRSSVSGHMMAIYPSPAGPTESLLPSAAWEQIAGQNPELQSMEIDVEALLVNRLGERHGFPGNQYLLAPIDECFKLVGLVRANWRGFSGGEELWRLLQDFFAALTLHAGTEPAVVFAELHHA